MVLEGGLELDCVHVEPVVVEPVAVESVTPRLERSVTSSSSCLEVDVFADFCTDLALQYCCAAVSVLPESAIFLESVVHGVESGVSHVAVAGANVQKRCESRGVAEERLALDLALADRASCVGVSEVHAAVCRNYGAHLFDHGVATGVAEYADVPIKCILDAHAVGEFFGSQLLAIELQENRARQDGSKSSRERSLLVAGVRNTFGAQCVEDFKNFQELRGMEFFDSLRVCGCWCKRVQFGLLYASCLGHLIMLYGCEVGTVKAHLVYSEVGQLSGKLVQAFVEDW